MNIAAIKPLTLAIGTCLVGTLSGYSIADTQQNPFVMTDLDRGYMVAGHEGICGEGKCGGARKPGNMGSDSAAKPLKEGQCGEGKCGGDKTANEAVCGIYKAGSAHTDDAKVKDGVCGGHRPVEMLCGDPR